MKFSCKRFKILVMVILHIYGGNAGCYWNTLAPGTECSMYCISETPESVDNSIMAKVNERENCTNSIILSLRSQSYPNSTIPAYFVNANIRVIDLEVTFSNAKAISVDAFASPAFGSVKKLIFSSFEIQLIPNGILNGMNALETFNIKGASSIATIEKGILDSLTELKEFTFEQTGKNNPIISLNVLTGSEHLPKLEYVKVKYKLANTIGPSTFTGLTNVKTLDLSSCQIEFLGANSFDPISNSIELLNLQGNLLTTLPDGLFDMMLPKDGLYIDLSLNKWNCDCALMWFQYKVELFGDNFNSPIQCETSGSCIASNILESECFHGCDEPTTRAPTTQPTTQSTTRPTTTTASSEYITKQCYVPDESLPSYEVSIKKSSNNMAITETDSGEVNVTVDSEDHSLVVIWFSNQGFDNTSVENINCMSRDESIFMPIANLKENINYVFCLMHTTSTQVSPLDCVVYKKANHPRDSAWLFQSNKLSTVALMVIGLVFSIALGAVVGYWIFNYFLKTESASNESYKSAISEITNLSSKRSNSNTTHDNDNIKRTTIEYDASTFSTPPLPERPANMRIFEEPVYASVEEMYNHTVE